MTLQAAYSFNAANANDESGNSNDGSIVGTNISWGTGHTSGGAISSGVATASYISIPAVSALQPASALTLELWAKVASDSGIPGIFIAGKPHATGGSADSYSIFTTATQTGFDLLTSAGEFTPVVSTSIADDTWHHVAVTYDGAHAQLWLDGTSVASVAATGTVVYDSSPLCLMGSSHFGGDRMVGTIDDVRFYDTALDEAAIGTDMDTPVGGSTPTAGGMFVLRDGIWQPATLTVARSGAFS
jgi:concanavalin A-like lectin/glucanase superfamily protein